nr:disabled homolog 2-like isoform X2 [Paramormyrops kingsleyae]
MQAEDGSQAAVSNAAQEQGTTKGRPPNKKASVSEKSPDYLAQRFQGDGVRYKAKLIGVDDVAEAQGDKMCLDSMMKLKGQEIAARQRGLHKQRVWLKVSDTCVRIIDEKTGAVEHKHELERISSVKKDDSQPRAFSYVYAHEGTFKLFFIKMANLADPVIEDIKDAFQIASAERSETLSTQNGPCLLLDEHVAIPPKGLDVIDLFNPLPSSPAQLSALTSCQDELNSVFNGTPATSTLEAASLAPTHWTSCSATGFLGQSAKANLTAWGPAGQPSVTSPGSLGPWGSAGQPSVTSPGSLGPWGSSGQPSTPSPGSLGPYGSAGQPSVTSPGSLGPWGSSGQPSVTSPGSPGPWGSSGQPSTPSPGSLGPYGSAGRPSVTSLGSPGSWDQQQTVSGRGQPSMEPQTGTQPLGLWTQPAGSMARVTAGFFATVGEVSSSGEMMFPQLSVASTSDQHAALQNHPAQAGLQPQTFG